MQDCRLINKPLERLGYLGDWVGWWELWDPLGKGKISDFASLYVFPIPMFTGRFVREEIENHG